MHGSVFRQTAAAFVLALTAAACGGADAPTDAQINETSEDSGTAGEEPEAADDTSDSGEAPDEPSGDAALDETVEPTLQVVVPVAPVADLVARVGGNRVEVTPLVPVGGDSHTYEPRPQDVVVLSEADAYLGIGLALNDAALALAEENLPEGSPIVLLGERALDDGDLVFDHTHGDDGHADDGHTHGDDGHADEGHTHDGDTAEDPGPNPHVWTSLHNASALVAEIEVALTELDPEGAEHYADGAAAYLDEIDALDRLVGDAAATIPAANRTLVTYHDAWAYFARDYDLGYATAVQPADFSEPSAVEVRHVIDLIREREVTAVFGSEVFPTPVLETIAEETGADYIADLEDDTLPGSPGDPEHSYLELMRRNARAIVDGLGGDAGSLP